MMHIFGFQSGDMAATAAGASAAKPVPGETFGVASSWAKAAGVGEPDVSRPAVGAAVGAAAEPSPVVVVTPALTPPTPPPGMERMLVVAWGPSVGFCASEEGGGDTEDVGCRVTRGETFLDIL